MICKTCNRKQAEDGRDECFRCRVLSVGFTYKGGAVQGKSGWGTSRQEWMAEHIGEIKGNPNIEPVQDHVRGC